MLKNKPVTLIIASGLLVVLVVLTLFFQFVGTTGMMGGQPGGRQGNFQPGDMPADGQMPDGVTPPSGGERPSGGGDFQPPAGMDQSGSFQDSGFGGSSTMMKLMQLLRGVQIGAVIVITLLGILAVVGMMMAKDWGRKLAITASILMLLSLIPSLFLRFMGSNLLVTLIKLALTVAILVLCFLPKSKQVASQI